MYCKVLHTMLLQVEGVPLINAPPIFCVKCIFFLMVHDFFFFNFSCISMDISCTRISAIARLLTPNPHGNYLSVTLLHFFLPAYYDLPLSALAIRLTSSVTTLSVSSFTASHINIARNHLLTLTIVRLI